MRETSLRGYKIANSPTPPSQRLCSWAVMQWCARQSHVIASPDAHCVGQLSQLFLPLTFSCQAPLRSLAKNIASAIADLPHAVVLADDPKARRQPDYFFSAILSQEYCSSCRWLTNRQWGNMSLTGSLVAYVQLEPTVSVLLCFLLTQQGVAAAVNSVKRTAADEKGSKGGRLERTLLRVVLALDKAYRGGQSRLDVLGEISTCASS